MSEKIMMITEINKEITEIKKRDPLTERIIACAYKVHSEIGPGFNEKIYHKALRIALDNESLHHDTEKEYKVFYQDELVGTLRMDLIVEDKVIVEVKAIMGNMPKIFEGQVLAYLKITGFSVGLLINFGNKSCFVRRLLFNLKSP